ncbi:glycoside hydrolase family 25 protein [Amanita thiersii Skay4041]|uniref:Lysozyme n=1 Tax=Amanita thiersii Skay4041 TaxID=703135 RepID=A0A2A9NCD1_9AGAR|nr:glycoside hydrolase family 25 protein [Amanita thiersii Skay4041]
MKWLFVLAFALSVVHTGAEAAKPQGIDVSGHQPNINWQQVKANGIAFAYIKATEGTNYKNPEFNKQYTGATNVDIIRGAYHFGLPDKSSGAAQANYFVSNGGGWSGDGRTLPGALDIEFNPYGQTCYNKSPSDMVAWIRDFSNTYKARTGRYPVIYTNTNWWKQCTGNSNVFASNNPLWIARYASKPGELPAGYMYETFWQYASSGPNPGDQNVFNGDMAGLQRFARG